MWFDVEDDDSDSNNNIEKSNWAPFMNPIFSFYILSLLVYGVLVHLDD